MAVAAIPAKVPGGNQPRPDRAEYSAHALQHSTSRLLCPVDVQHGLEVLIPILGAVAYLGRLIGKLETKISAVVETVHEIKGSKLPDRMTRVETHLGITIQ